MSRNEVENKSHESYEKKVGTLALLQRVCASLQVHVEVPSSAERAPAVAKPLKVLLAGVEGPVGIRWVLLSAH